jgi:hypothetical protein
MRPMRSATAEFKLPAESRTAVRDKVWLCAGAGDEAHFDKVK